MRAATAPRAAASAPASLDASVGERVDQRDTVHPAQDDVGICEAASGLLDIQWLWHRYDASDEPQQRRLARAGFWLAGVEAHDDGVWMLGEGHAVVAVGQATHHARGAGDMGAWPAWGQQALQGCGVYRERRRMAIPSSCHRVSFQRENPPMTQNAGYPPWKVSGVRVSASTRTVGVTRCHA